MFLAAPLPKPPSERSPQSGDDVEDCANTGTITS